MPATALHSNRRLALYRPEWLVLWLTIVWLAPDQIHAATLSNVTGTEESTGATHSRSVIGTNVDDETVAIGRRVTLEPGLVDDAHTRLPSKVLKEVGKQAIDQPGHFLIAAAPIWASRCLVGVPWYGWVAAPLLAYREWLQWPSNRWWDPPLDWAFLSLGAVVATFRRRRSHRLPDGLQPLRDALGRGLSFLLATGRRTPAAT
jgi:hypothetical protein